MTAVQGSDIPHSQVSREEHGCSPNESKSLLNLLLCEENERLGPLYCIFSIFEKLPKQFQAELKQSYWCQGAKCFPHALLSEEGRKLFVLSSPSLSSLSQGSEERMDK